MTDKTIRKFTEEEKADIQAYITSSFTHLDYAAFLFLQITDRAALQKWLQNQLDNDGISSARTWPKIQGVKQKPESTLNIAFTNAGLAAMGVSDEVMCTFPQEFREGMVTEDRSQILGDTGISGPENWEIGGPNNEMPHIFLALYGADKATLDSTIDDIITNNGLNLLTREDAERLDSDREHFGFHDGIGQPKIAGVVDKRYDNHPDLVPSGEFILGYKNAYNFYPTTPLVPNALDPDDILPADPNPFHLDTYKDFGRNGSYIVYRKLEQNVAAFWAFMEENAKRLTNVNGELGWKMLWLASKCVGRWPSGVPLIKAPDEDDPKIKDKNDFFYMESDENGLACPFGAHIRRSNPRDSIMPKNAENSITTNRRHRIMRRGLTYGAPLFDHDILLDVANRGKLSALLDLSSNPNKDEPRGFHFAPVVANIQRQFEFIQQTWSNNPAFNGLSQSKDPVMGSNPDVGNAPDPDNPSYMTIPHQPNLIRTTPLTRFVTVKGGAYCFMPSLTTLRYLAKLS